MGTEEHEEHDEQEDDVENEDGNDDSLDAIDRLKLRAKDSTNPLKSIKAFCSECVGTIRVGKECIDPNCPLFDFREGKNTRRKPRTMSAERREQMAEHMRKVHAKRKTKKG